MNANVSNIKDHAADAFDSVKAKATSPEAVKVAKTVGKYSAIAVGAGVGYAVFATVANKVYAALN